MIIAKNPWYTSMLREASVLRCGDNAGTLASDVHTFFYALRYPRRSLNRREA
jgi:hypothetical protein